ncbi:MAG: 4-hydroxy-tetrahydrodipicolinate synthase, partial [Clostridia bacterium]|nr:4-hydroxy-tetrahydrodipicolinate synthase [Clostridia bacterium]
GCATALLTPFTEDNKIDSDALSRLIDRQISAGISALAVCATTGECATLDDGEFENIVSFAVKRAAGRIPVVAGTGRNSTEKTLKLSQIAENRGAAALLCVTPYYNKTTQKGLVDHYYYLADRVNIPVILYNVPSRTGMTVTPETYAELSRHPNIYGAKEASGDLSLIARAAAQSRNDFTFYSGHDDQTLAIYSLGGKGVISTASNVAPEKVASLCSACEKGELDRARALQFELLPLCDALFAEVNPIPLKAAAEMLGLCKGYLRPPLTRASDKTRKLLKNALNV